MLVLFLSHPRVRPDLGGRYEYDAVGGSMKMETTPPSREAYPNDVSNQE
jgi:hypothetical protein